MLQTMQQIWGMSLTYLFCRLRSTGGSTATGGIGDGVRNVVLVLIGGTTVVVGREATAGLPADVERTVGGGSTMFLPNAGEGDLAVRPSNETPLLPCAAAGRAEPNLAGGGAGGWSLA